MFISQTVGVEMQVSKLSHFYHFKWRCLKIGIIKQKLLLLHTGSFYCIYSHPQILVSSFHFQKRLKCYNRTLNIDISD